jgi:hypothetical protein
MKPGEIHAEVHEINKLFRAHLKSARAYYAGLVDAMKESMLKCKDEELARLWKGEPEDAGALGRAVDWYLENKK